MADTREPRETLHDILEALKELLTITKVKIPNSPDNLLTLSEAAKLLNLSESTLNYYTDKKYISYRRIGKHKRFIRQELMDWIVGANQVVVKSVRSSKKSKSKVPCH